jgi:glycosyltransferase involved in cell wall biosynthesis
MIKKIRIIFIIDSLYSLAGGTENQLVKIINHLDPNLFELNLFVLRNTQWIEKNKSKLKCETKIFNLERLSSPFSVFSYISLVLSIKRIRPDVVMTFFRWADVIGVLAARLAGVKYILSTRRDYGLGLQRIYMILLRWANRFVHKIITNSKIVRLVTAEREKYHVRDIHVIYNGIDTHQNSKKLIPEQKEAVKAKLGIPPDHNIIGIIGGLKPMKRHITFIKAAEKTLRLRNDLSFVIIGDGVRRKSLESLTKSLGIEQYVYFLGEQEDISPYISLFDIAVNCSSHEGLSNAIMEYMIYEIPCVVADAGGNPELIQNGVNGYTFALDDVAGLSDKIIQLLNGASERKKFVSISKNMIRKDFSMENMKKNYEEFFIRLTEN